LTYLCYVIKEYENYSREELISTLYAIKSDNEFLKINLDKATEKLLAFEKILGQSELKTIKLEAELADLKRMIFGSRSERFAPAIIPGQMVLFLEAEKAKAIEVKKQTITYDRNKTEKQKITSPGRKPFAASIPRTQIIIEPEEEITGLKKIGEEITEELEYKPGSLFVNQYIRPKYARQNGEGVLIGSLPSRPIEKGIPGPGLLAHLHVQKYVDHLPWYRQAQMFKRGGVDINESTINGWFNASTKLLNLLFDLHRKEILSGDYIMVDESPIRVLDQNLKGKSHRGYYWVYYSPEKRLVLFDYRPGRGSDGPDELLKNYEGYLQTDGYAVYKNFDSEKIKLFHCMAHARRKFDEALKNDQDRADFVLFKMQCLYAIERYASENKISVEQRLKCRQDDAMPILLELKQWLSDNKNQVTPESKIGMAINYSLSRWDKLMLYATNGRLEIDNNLVENSIRPLAIGRKNYLFAGSHEAAEKAAMMYSFFGTCKLHHIEPFEWLRNTFANINETKSSQLSSLLPFKI
jgi:transposase